jgi:hypothetical protein
MITSNSVTLLETYLLDSLLILISDTNRLKKFAKAFVPMKSKMIPLNEIFDKIDGIEKVVTDEIYKIQFHNLSTVNGMYASVGVEFPKMSAQRMGNIMFSTTQR